MANVTKTWFLKGEIYFEETHADGLACLGSFIYGLGYDEANMIVGVGYGNNDGAPFKITGDDIELSEIEGESFIYVKTLYKDGLTSTTELVHSNSEAPETNGKYRYTKLYDLFDMIVIKDYRNNELINENKLIYQEGKLYSVVNGVASNEVEIEVVGETDVGLITAYNSAGMLVPTTVTQIPFTTVNNTHANDFANGANNAITILKTGVWQASIKTNSLKTGSGIDGQYALGIGINGAQPQKGSWQTVQVTEQGSTDNTTAMNIFTGFVNENDIIRFYHIDTGDGTIELINDDYNYPIFITCDLVAKLEATAIGTGEQGGIVGDYIVDVNTNDEISYEFEKSNGEFLDLNIKSAYINKLLSDIILPTGTYLTKIEILELMETYGVDAFSCNLTASVAGNVFKDGARIFSGSSNGTITFNKSMNSGLNIVTNARNGTTPITHVYVVLEDDILDFAHSEVVAGYTMIGYGGFNSVIDLDIPTGVLYVGSAGNVLDLPNGHGGYGYGYYQRRGSDRVVELTDRFGNRFLQTYENTSAMWQGWKKYTLADV